MKTTLIVTALLLATAIVSPSYAGEFWFKPDGSGLTPGAAKIISRPPPTVGTVKSRDLNPPDYVTRYNLTTHHGDGSTSTYNSTSRFYYSR